MTVINFLKNVFSICDANQHLCLPSGACQRTKPDAHNLFPVSGLMHQKFQKYHLYNYSDKSEN